MRQTRIIIAFTLWAAIVPALSQAQEQRDRFQQRDANNDGKLTVDELPEQARNRFPQPTGKKIAPTHGDIHYGNHERHFTLVGFSRPLGRPQ